MFDGIARRYDAFNTIVSLGRDEAWRRRTVALAAPAPVARGLDAAAGTGRLTAALAQQADRVIALDFSAGMLRGAREHIARRDGLAGRADLVQGDVLTLPFPSGSFDCTTVGFGLRNLADIPRGLAELHRTLRPGGRLAVLDIVRPQRALPRLAYALVFKRAMPLLGWALSGDRNAYRYLPSSVERYLNPAELAAAMSAAGFIDVDYQTQALGSIAIHVGVKGSHR